MKIALLALICSLIVTFPYETKSKIKIKKDTYQKRFEIIKRRNLNKLNMKPFNSGKKIKVALIDTGVDFLNPIFSKNIIFPTNGYLNIEGKSNYYDDYNDHGSLITSILLSLSNDILIMPFKVNTMNIDESKKAIRSAIDSEVDIISFSLSGSVNDDEEKALIKEAINKGIYFICAAGNNRADMAKEKFFPSSYNLDNMISVANHNKYGERQYESNYGFNDVDIAALGKDLYGLDRQGNVTVKTGTSMSVPVVVAFVAELISQNKDVFSNLERYSNQTSWTTFGNLNIKQYQDL